MSASLISRLAGPAAVVSGALLVAGELIIWQFDVSDHVATSTDPLFQVGQAIYFLGFVGLMVFLFASSRTYDDRGSRFGVFATLAALVGTMALGGDLWFESFAVPWIADEVPGAFDTDPTVVLALGAISSYLLFAIGWVLYGIAGFRTRAYPRWLTVALVIAGALGFNALLAPFGLPLGLVVGTIGIWTLRTRSRADREVPATREPVSIG
jgi:hypothetical protein